MSALATIRMGPIASVVEARARRGGRDDDLQRTAEKGRAPIPRRLAREQRLHQLVGRKRLAQAHADAPKIATIGPGPTEEARVAEPNTRPWERDYAIKQSPVLAETAELVVRRTPDTKLDA